MKKINKNTKGQTDKHKHVCEKQRNSHRIIIEHLILQKQQRTLTLLEPKKEKERKNEKAEERKADNNEKYHYGQPTNEKSSGLYYL